MRTPSASSTPRDYAVVSSIEDVRALAAALTAAGQIGIAPIAAGTSAVQAPIVGWSFSTAPGMARYIPIGHVGLPDIPNLPAREVYEALRLVLADPAIEKIGHDLKFALIALEREGLQHDERVRDLERALRDRREPGGHRRGRAVAVRGSAE